jgi:4-amino-4-deoxy-L-arabinose transferase-like glycosyltransferase
MNKGIPSAEFGFRVAPRWELLVFLLLVAGGIFLRMCALDADPPYEITFSKGIETDAPQYTVYARNEIVTGEWNPYNDNRYITYQYSLVSLVSWLTFLVFGVGTFQINLAANILSILSILIFYLIMRKIAGNGAALLSLFFLAINYIAIFFGRRPFLETGMNLLFLAGLCCVVYLEKRVIGHILFGAFSAAAVVFGKIIGLIFLGPIGAYYILRLWYAKDKKAIPQFLAMIVGFGAVGVTWMLWIYLPHQASFSGYVGEQAFGLYGTPEAFQSVLHFFWKILAFGKGTQFFDRMPSLAIGSLFCIIVLAARLFRADDKGTAAPAPNLFLIVLAAWLISAYCSLMPWNYRPLRYQTMMLFPLTGLTACLMSYLITMKKPVRMWNRSVRFQAIFFSLLILLTYQLMAAVVVNRGGEFYFKKYILSVIGVAGFIWSVFLLFTYRCRAREITFAPGLRYTLIAFILLLSIFYHGKNYLAWAKVPLYTTRDASRDLGTLLTPGAVVSGPYAPALTMENNLGCLIHIFGTTRPDPELFERFPVTHLALDESNKLVAEELYPDIMNKSYMIATYFVNCRKIEIYRIAYFTGNLQAHDYLLSNFERAVHFYRHNSADSADFYIERYLSLYPDNISGNLYAGGRALADSKFAEAVRYFKDAAAVDGTDFNVHYLVASTYTSWAKATGNDSLLRLGEIYEDSAYRYNLADIDLVKKVDSTKTDAEEIPGGEGK